MWSYLFLCPLLIITSTLENESSIENVSAVDVQESNLVEDNSTAKADVSEISYESKLRRLGEIVDKIDKDEDKKVTKDELIAWICYMQTRDIKADADQQFKLHDINKDEKVAWEEYKENTYGFLSEEQVKADNAQFGYEYMLNRDKRRWNAADLNQDNFCSEEEFYSFLHPEQVDHTKNIVVKETIEDIDKNKDGVIDIQEYIDEMVELYHSQPEPPWVEKERENFLKNKDRDHDNVLSEAEVRAWLLPDDHNRIDDEASYLISEADDNNDGELSKAEILRHYQKFAVSQATAWGDELKHDEF